MPFHRYHVLAFAVVACMHQTTFAQSSIYNIASASLSQTMAQIARQNSVSLSADPELLKGKIAPSIKGSYDIDTAFNLALAGSGLQLLKNSDGTVYSLKKSELQEKPQARDVGQLKKIDVTATTSKNSNTTQLPVITVNAEEDGSAKNGYLIKKITGVGLWGERDLQDTPYSMTVISQDLIENTLAKDMNQIFKLNPTTQERGQASSNVGDVQWPNIRGFRVQNPIVNGISYANYISSTPMMQDIERVEIINGATGFLYGGGRVGGAINYITKKPTLEDLRNVTLGSYGDHSYYGHLDLGGQFDQEHTFGYRANMMFQDGELSNTTETEQKAASLVFDWKPLDQLYTDIKYSYKEVLKKGGNSFFTSIDDRASIKNNKSYNPNWLQNEIESNRVENNIKWKINDLFSLRTSVFYEKLKYRGDVSWITYKNNQIVGGKTNLYKYDWEETENNGVNVFLDSGFTTGNIDHMLTIGYSLNTSKLSIRDNNYNGYLITNNMSLNELKNLDEPDLSLWSRPSGAGELKPNSRKQYNNILIGDDIAFNDQWSALIGANYATVMNKTYSSNTSYDKSKLTPTLSLIYKPLPYLTTYATYIESLEAGTVVGSQYSNANEVLAPLVSKQYEVGTKYNFSDGILLTGALFRIEKANQYSDLTTPIPKYVQDGLQIHQGIELGLTGKVNDHLTLISGLTFMDIAVDQSNNKALEGKKPTEAASKMAKIYAEYNIPYINGLTITGGAFYTGKKYADGLNTDVMPAYTLFDLGMRYSSKIGNYPTTYNLNIQNITNKTYWTNSWQLGDPRTVAFSIKTQF